MALGEVVEGPSLFGVRQGVGASVVLDGDVTLLDVDVGGAVLARGVATRDVYSKGTISITKCNSLRAMIV